VRADPRGKVERNNEEKKDWRQIDEEGGWTGKENKKIYKNWFQNVEIKRETMRELRRRQEDLPGVEL
jgi:hypothetical protein